MRVVRPKIRYSFRAISAALLMLALLSSAAPFTALSAAHSCSMPCCAGHDGACATGACEGGLFKSPKKQEEEKLCGAEDAHATLGAHSHEAHAAVDKTDTDHCDSDKRESSKAERQRDASDENQTRSSENRTDATNNVSSLAVAAPCSNNCCGGSSAASQSRRGRDNTLVSASESTRPSALNSARLRAKNLTPVTSAHLKRLRPRAPPVSAPPISA